MNFHLLGTATLALALAACGPKPAQLQIGEDENSMVEAGVIDGEVIVSRNTKASRSVVAVELIDKNKEIITYCTGVIIDKNTVLTAAHCLSDSRVPGVVGFNIVFETRTKFMGEPVRRAGGGFVLHPQYNTEKKKWVYRDKKYIDPDLHSGFEERSSDKVSYVAQSDHDLAVTVFKGDMPSGFEAIPIDENTSANYAGSTIYLYGYGRAVDYLDKKGKYDTSTGQLRKGVAIVDKDFNHFEDRYFTSAASKNSLCQGDSGGPQFSHEKENIRVIGINSAVAVDENSRRVDKSISGDGDLFSCRGRSQVAKVAPYADWIKSQQRRLLKDLNR